MDWKQQLLQELADAARDIETATDQRDELIRAAVDAGITHDTIAAAARIGRTTVWRIGVRDRE